MSVSKVTSFRCPVQDCRAEIPLDNIKRFTKIIEIKGKEIMVCPACAIRYENEVLSVMRKRVTEATAREMGISPEAVEALREERLYYEKDDEAQIADEVDVMDAEKANRILKKKGDAYEANRTVLQVLQERFQRGLEKERQRKIISPVKGPLIQPANKYTPIPARK